jgi:TRAP-type C4-dicarboxylate transport system permease small subunit
MRGMALWVLLLLGSSPAWSEPTAEPAAAPAAVPSVYVVRRGWHIDVGFATQDLREPLRSIARNFTEAKFVFFGFGDMHYLADEKNQHGPAMIAALWPGKGIILVTTLQAAPSEAFGSTQVIMLNASEKQLQDTQDYIWKSLATAPQGVEVYRPGPYEGGYYFLALPKYSAFHTCNTWAAQTLRAAGFPIRARGVLFAHQLWSQVRRTHQLQGGLVPS